jgi:hypothetical protein
MTNPQDYSIASKCSEGGKKEWDRIKDDINLEYLFQAS